VPTYIDQSYIKEQLNAPSKKIVKDNITNEEYLIQSKILRDENNEEIGIIVQGKSLRILKKILAAYIISTASTL
jgi:TPP-dependent indolepyruvate ferredoxin oxidoreductase alpha subunit